MVSSLYILYVPYKLALFSKSGNSAHGSIANFLIGDNGLNSVS